MVVCLVCGSRNADEKMFTNLVETFLDFVLAPYIAKQEPITIVNGDATGIDYIATKYAKKHNFQVALYPAQWNPNVPRYSLENRSQGPIRNKKMVDETKPDIIVSFPRHKSSGTKNCVEYAKKQLPNSLFYEQIID